MPYESFPWQHQLSIRGLVQDTSTGSWRFLLHVKRSMEGHARPQVYAIRRSYADFKRLHAAISPALAVLPKLPVDSLFSFFVGETQTVLQKKRVVLDAILKAIESHPRARDAAPFLEFAANTESYEMFSEAPPSPVGSFKEFNASYEFHKTAHTQLLHGSGGSGGGGAHSAAAIHHQPGSNHPELVRRRNSTMMLLPTRPTQVANDGDSNAKRGSVGDAGERPRRHTIEADMENRVDFSRYSQT